MGGNTSNRKGCGQDAVIQNGHIVTSSTAFTLVLRTSSEYPVVPRNPFFFTESAHSSSSQWAWRGANPESSLDSPFLTPSEDVRMNTQSDQPRKYGYIPPPIENIFFPRLTVFRGDFAIAPEAFHSACHSRVVWSMVGAHSHVVN